ncbi:MAG: restriction system protein, partial [Patescibacteria group bacterium]|nr:restriction system protein [Patescibacteria group bacterium]
MARRRKRNDDVNISGLIVIAFIGTVVGYHQNSKSIFWLSVLVLSIALLIVFVQLWLHLRKQAKLQKSGIHEIDIMSGLEFEKYLKLLLEQHDYSRVRLTGYYDLSIDIIAEKDNEIWGIQAKRYKGTVGLDAVRQAVAAREHYKCTKSIVITNSYFTRNAKTIADSVGCTLIDRDLLIDLSLSQIASRST